MKVLTLVTLGFAVLSVGSGALADTYYYDAKGHVIAIKYDDGKTVCYTYDKNGNRISAVSGCTPPPQ